MSLIIPNLYVGDINSAHTYEWLTKHNIKLIINCAIEIKNKFSKKIKTISLKYDDTPHQKLFPLLSDVYNKYIYPYLKEKKSILIHCYAGISRSASVAIYSIMMYKNISFPHAYMITKDKRGKIYPNDGFIFQLSSI